jgi:hypothetical protein
VLLPRLNGHAIFTAGATLVFARVSARMPDGSLRGYDFPSVFKSQSCPQ